MAMLDCPKSSLQTGSLSSALLESAGSSRASITSAKANVRVSRAHNESGEKSSGCAATFVASSVNDRAAVRIVEQRAAAADFGVKRFDAEKVGMKPDDLGCAWLFGHEPNVLIRDEEDERVGLKLVPSRIGPEHAGAGRSSRP